jgi:hypothetical protein
MPSLHSRASAANSAAAHCPASRSRPNSGAPGHRPRLAGAADPAAFDVAGVAVEHPVLGAAVALRGEQDAVRGAGDATFDEVDVGLLAGLEHAELGVDGGVVGDHPPRPRAGTVQRAVPGGPAITGGWAVDVGAGASVEVDGGRAAPPDAVDGFVVVEAATAVLDRGDVELVLAQRGFSSREGARRPRGSRGGGVRRAERGDGCRSRPGRQSTCRTPSALRRWPRLDVEESRVPRPGTTTWFPHLDGVVSICPQVRRLPPDDQRLAS